MKIAQGTKWRIGLRGVRSTLRQPEYLMLSIGVAAGILLVLQWFFNAELLGFVLSTDILSVRERIEFILSGYSNIFSNLHDFRAIALVVISITQGIAVAILVHTVRRSEDYFGNQGHIRNVALTLLGSGCTACGGSIAAPLLTWLSAGVSTVVSAWLGQVILLVALVLSIKSLRDAGVEAVRVEAMERRLSND